jgi:type-F conjugative transfer system pilin assembly protein TrbC
MLRKLLIIIQLMSASYAIYAVDTGDRETVLDSAQAAMQEKGEMVDDVFQQADALLGEDTKAAEARAEIESVEPASLGKIEGLLSKTPKIDLNALFSKYESQFNNDAVGDNNNLLIFVSSSVPIRSLQHLARDSLRVGATLVLRGVVGDDLTSTAEFLQKVFDGLEVKPKTVIDPSLFTRYGVKQVPAFVYAPTGVCMGGATRCKSEPDQHIHVAGDVSLVYAIDFMTNKEGADTSGLASIKMKMEGGK